jgi:dTDP-4-amino-4,6-dideoxy-D-galactose acyltransferase
MSQAPCELLEWDSAFFAVRIARVAEAGGDFSCDAVEAWCREHGVDCLYYLADAAIEDPALVARGFVPVDVRLTLEMPLDAGLDRAAESVRPARAEDLPALREIAAISHSASRFFADPRFRTRAPALYETWIEKSLQGMADAVLVADTGAPVGYITCNRHDDGTGQIGLFAVAASAQGRGLGGALVRGALSWLGRGGCHTARVVAQGGNTRAVAAYERSGFRPLRSQRWYHRWFSHDSQ